MAQGLQRPLYPAALDRHACPTLPGLVHFSVAIEGAHFVRGLVDGEEARGDDDSLEAVDRSIAEAEAELRRLRQRREVLAAEGSD